MASQGVTLLRWWGRVFAPRFAFLPLWVLAFGLGTFWLSCDTGGDRDPCDPAGARTMEVRRGGDTAEVDLGALPGRRQGDLCLVPLDRIVENSGLGIDMDRAVFDFEGEDGFRPSQVDCAPLDGATLSRGWADMSTGTLVWDDSLGLRGCYSVSKAAVILAMDAR